MVAAATRRLVRQRAAHLCEYCRTRQLDEPFLTYQIEHVIALQHGGTDAEDNSALACSHCNLMKGPNLAGIDPLTGAIEPLFHPRRQSWEEHFEWHQVVIAGKTPCGRATVRVLAMNADARVELRREILRAESG
jgi:hypothetical protein